MTNSKSRRRFTREYKQSIAQRALDGESPTAIAKGEGLGTPQVYQWKKQYAEPRLIKNSMSPQPAEDTPMNYAQELEQELATTKKQLDACESALRLEKDSVEFHKRLLETSRRNLDEQLKLNEDLANDKMALQTALRVVLATG